MRAATDAPPLGQATPQELTGHITTELLVPYFRVVRSPLSTWTASLHERLTASSARPKGEWFAACEGIASCFNEGALVEVHFGRPDHALALCLREAEWARQISLAPDRLAAIQFAFQPHINIGRLHRQRGRWDDAIHAFRHLKDFCDWSSVEIDGLGVTHDHARAIQQASPEFVDQMLANYLIDTLVTLLRAERFVDACTLAGAAPATRYEWANDLVHEAHIIALSYLGRIDAAWGQVHAYLRRSHRPHGSVFLYRQAELMLASGDRAGAERTTIGLAVAHLMSRGPVDSLNLRLMVRLVKLLATLGNERAWTLARAALSSARASDDVLLQQEILTLLAAQAPTAEERSGARAQADTLRTGSWYGAARAKEADGAGERYASIDRLYDRLLSCTDPS